MIENVSTKEGDFNKDMNTNNIERPIGVFDSGIGGITVLPDVVELLPQERFIYFGDSANAPYGVKDAETVKRLVMNAAQILLDENIKALVVACNTATSVSIDYLRSNLDIPVIGMEPALKPAAESGKTGAVVVMATPLTLKETKFNNLMKSYEDRRKIIPLPCPGLVELIEDGKWEGKELDQYLKNLFSNVDINDITDIVLGCTHYVFIKEYLNMFFNGKVKIVDGNRGTARQLKRVLSSRNLDIKDYQSSQHDDNNITFHFSSAEKPVINKCKEWLVHQSVRQN